jgi:hypothetical protein
MRSIEAPFTHPAFPVELNRPTERTDMVELPQYGRCLCRDIEYKVVEDPVMVYLCHCTDCQTQSGASFAISMILRQEGLEITRGQPERIRIDLEDGRVRYFTVCGRCYVRLSGDSSVPRLQVLEPGTLDDTSWLHPVGHIWARSAQPWFQFEEGTLVFQKQPQGDEQLELVRAWKSRTVFSGKGENRNAGEGESE